MFSKLVFVLSTLALAIQGSYARPTSPAPTPAPPGLNFLYSLNCTLGTAIPVGTGPRGSRIVIPITGGTFQGPKLKGKILNLGADWALSSTSGAESTTNVDTRYQLVTDDGANIFIQTNGPAKKDGKIHLRMTFETGSAKYFWLNSVVAVGILTTGNGFVAIDAWEVVSPVGL
ncbi:hypothetical protein SMAC4_12887 [Sordaria macrospora]|uniref:uncharacterized protein n=1 Tax=Sordaria macrospora TaxID=5147 RepID=UPI001DA01CC8|nr:hypothetical protein B0T09DRAFT_294225 [Sordaria sp. MPI-SDFR-AT-0083]WPJ65970.1 hypothetical protein SMAC4_12887 [Sordaria macrospora]